MEKHDKAEMAADKKMIKSAIGKHEKRLHPGKAPTKLRKGGVTSKAMRAVGRNMARANNQRGG